METRGSEKRINALRGLGKIHSSIDLVNRKMQDRELISRLAFNAYKKSVEDQQV
jgi:hypothetical protein